MPTLAVDEQTVRKLVSDVRLGDRAAADQLVRAHDGWLRSVIFAVTGRRELVDDVAQQVWTQAWQRLDSLEDAARLRPWLYSIARHAAIDAGMAHRRRSSRTRPIEAAEQAMDTAAMDPRLRVSQDEVRDTVMIAILSLPAIYREPFMLRHLEGWNYGQIGDLLGLPYDTVETRLTRARRLLREALAGKL